MSEVRSMAKIKPHVYRDGHVYLSNHGSIEMVLVSASAFHDMELEIAKLKNEIKTGVVYQVV